MLNARIEIDTATIPYKIKRVKPSFLNPYFTENIEWIIFCDNIDYRIKSYEEIKAAWMIIGAVFTLLLIGLIVGIICRFILVDDPDLGLVLSGSLFGGLVVLFVAYFCLMKVFVIQRLDLLAQSIDEYCQNTAKQWENVEFRFERSKKSSIYWDSDFNAWINVISSDAV